MHAHARAADRAVSAAAARGSARRMDGGTLYAAASRSMHNAGLTGERAANYAKAKYDAAMDFKNRWYSWIFSTPPNIPLIVSNLCYVAVTTTALILTILVMEEHASDFRKNSLRVFRDPNKLFESHPCGMPTPDGKYLLHALGAVGDSGGWDLFPEPSYKTWMQKIDRALCSKLVPGADPHPDFPPKPDCTGHSDYGIDYVEELLTLGFLLNDNNIMPNADDLADPLMAPNKIEAKKLLLDGLACIHDEHSNEDHRNTFYSKTQYDAYGDLKTRVARAYVAAMPAFSRYEKERLACQDSATGRFDPFDNNCRHACHVKRELKNAAADQFSMYRSRDAEQLHTTVPFPKQLYRLLALSLAGYVDRLHNDGACFRNGMGPIGEMSALEFCAEAMDENPGLAAEQGKTQKEAFTIFTETNEALSEKHQCKDAAVFPPPPAPPVFRAEVEQLTTNDRIGPAVCAATLEYGLMDQGRLFGIPDVIMPFVTDNHPRQGWRFISRWIINALYTDPADSGALVFADPKARLELYVAYRLASSSIWAILVCNCAGFWLARAAVPLFVALLKAIGVRSNVRYVKRVNGVEQVLDEFKPIELYRPQPHVLVNLTLVVTALTVVGMLLLNPAADLHYYTDTDCTDWSGLGVHVPSGAWTSSWGKRRFERFGEYLIALLLFLTICIFFFQKFIGRALVSKEQKDAATDMEPGVTARSKAVPYFLVGFAVLVQIFFSLQAGYSGGDWLEAAKGDSIADADHDPVDALAKDVLMAVWTAFWNAFAIGFYRQKWCIQMLPSLYQYAWMAGCVLLVWVPSIQSYALLSDQIDDAFRDGNGSPDKGRRNRYIVIYVVSAVWTGLLIFRLLDVWKAMDAREKEFWDAETVADAKDAAITNLAEAKQANEAIEDQADWLTKSGPGATQARAPTSKFRFNLSRARIAPANGSAARSFGASARASSRVAFALPARDERRSVYMPLMPKL